MFLHVFGVGYGPIYGGFDLVGIFNIVTGDEIYLQFTYQSGDVGMGCVTVFSCTAHIFYTFTSQVEAFFFQVIFTGLQGEFYEYIHICFTRKPGVLGHRTHQDSLGIDTFSNGNRVNYAY
ncbi:MAG: hypothetical protein A4E26_00478 [Methanobacterium sp. PtaU1.Bin097]|nr:MAG: hypothetical protein A4E26_00478 [Methanobacterium sp. PtaU1.Bin097]